MSNTGRNTNNQPLRPKLAANPTSRVPLTPRVAAARSTPAVRSDPPIARVRASNQETPTRDIIGSNNVTPRSSVRSAKFGSASNTPTQTNSTPSALSPRPATTSSLEIGERKIVAGANNLKVGRPKSVVSSVTSAPASQGHLSPGIYEASDGHKGNGLDDRFFHASDALEQDIVPKRPEPKKAPSFFYADGQHEDKKSQLPGASSPVLSAVSGQRSAGPWIRADKSSVPSKSPPMLSPSLSTISNTPSFFTAMSTQEGFQRPPSPTKENIHLSYRKGASQIFGTRPLPTSRMSNDTLHSVGSLGHRGSVDSTTNAITHRKSPSLSSIDSGSSPPSRRRSATIIETPASPSSPLMHEIRPVTIARVVKPPGDLPSINTSLEKPEVGSPPPESTLSPTKGASELAADARRERKILDLEISNSSLMAINSSLEREVRRQKAELKRFRRLSRAGRFSFGSSDRTARFSEGLSAVGEEDEDNDDSEYALPSGLTDGYDDYSDDDSVASSTDLTSLSTSSRAESDRLAKDERRLQIDFAKHKELLVQSQMMNQSIKRCIYASENMIQEGKKALDYHVRVSDIKLGGRVLSNPDDEIEIHDIEVDEVPPEDTVEQAKGFMDVWSGLGRPSYENSDRDSGIEVERQLGHVYVPVNKVETADMEMPPFAVEETDAIS